jgi:hypothetical protein
MAENDNPSRDAGPIGASAEVDSDLPSRVQNEVSAEKATIAARASSTAPPPSQFGTASTLDYFFSRMNDFFSSGIFFILLGIGLLYFAWRGLTVGIHTSFSFVLVVLGIAVMLFGTGTQGMGRLTSSEAVGRYTISIAGGAGIIAVAIGYGMVMLGPKIQEVFELQTHYAWVELRASDPRCSLEINRYWAEFTSNGETLAYKSRKGQIFVLLPYYYNELQRANVIGGADDKKTIDAEFIVKDQKDLKENLLCAPNPKGHVDVAVSELNLQDDSGFDFNKTRMHTFNLVNVDDPSSKLLAAQAIQPPPTNALAQPPNVQNLPLPLSVSQ